MKKKYAMILAGMLATGALAQTDTNTPALTPAPGSATPAATPATPPPMVTPVDITTNKPPKKATAKKKTVAKAKKPAPIEAPGAPFMANETAVAKQNNINVRAQSHINSEVVFHLKQGDNVTVMKEVTLPHPKTDEPAAWVQIMLPAGTPVWVSSALLDENSTVKAKKLNVRSGPGENFSVVGMLQKGDAVKTIHTKEGWTQIEAPTNSFGFVAAHLLAHKELTPPVELTSIQPTPTPTPVITPVPDNNMGVTPATGTPGTGGTTPTPTPTPMPVVPTPAVDTAPSGPVERVVAREGMVGDTVSVQAPTYFQLESLDDGKPIEYLYTTSSNLVLDHWRGKKVLVSGIESLDERWPSTPVLTIQKIQIIK
jgi:uncharacterized protein YgiM (DUF1202 family)